MKNISKTISIFAITLATVLISAFISLAAGLEDLFNDNVLVSRDGTSVTLSNVAVQDKVYKGTWTLDSSFNLKITDVQVENEGASFDSARAWMALNEATTIGADDPAISRFSDTEGCESFATYDKDGVPYYFCLGSNFVRILGGISPNYLLEFKGMDMPLYMAAGTSATKKIQGTLTSASGNFDFTMYMNMAIFDTGDTWTGLLSTYTGTKYSSRLVVFHKESYEVLESKGAFSTWPTE